MKKNFLSLWALVALISLALLACKGEACDDCSPTQPNTCVTTYPSMNGSIPYTGGSGSVSVSITPGCVLTCTGSPSTNVSWITNLSVDNGRVSFVAQPNTGAARTGTISYCGGSWTIPQDAAPPAQACIYTAQSTSGSFTTCKAGEELRFPISIQGSCPLPTPQVIEGASWLTAFVCTNCGANVIVARTTQDNNTGASRTGVIRVADGCEIRVTQPPCPPQPQACTFDLSPKSLHFACPGGSQTITVTTNRNDCAWFAMNGTNGVTVSRHGEWISGTNTVTVSVGQNGTSMREDFISIAGRSVKVTQDACTVVQPQTCQDPRAINYGGPLPCQYPPPPTCEYAVPPTTPQVACSGTSNGSIIVSANCPWTATSLTSALTITGGASGSGNGTITFSVAANSGGARDLAVRVTGQNGFSATVSVPQAAACAAACTFAVPPSTPEFEWQGTANGSIIFQASSPTCSWTASDDAGWITLAVTSGSGSTTYSIPFVVGGNPGAARTGHVTITGGGNSYVVAIPQKAHP